MYHLALQFGVLLQFGWLRCICIKYIYIYFFHFETWVVSRDPWVLITCKVKIRIKYLPVYLGYKGTNNGWRVTCSLQLLKNYKDVNQQEELVIWLQINWLKIFLTYRKSRDVGKQYSKVRYCKFSLHYCWPTIHAVYAYQKHIWKCYL